MPNATPSPDPSRSAHPGSALFEEYYDRLMAIARQRMEIEWRSHRLEHLQYLRSDLLELHREFGALLRVVFRYGLAEALREEFRWFASVLANRKSPHDALALLLDSWIVAIQGLVRPPECNLLAAPLKGLREALPSLLSETPRPSGSDAPVKAIIGKLITGDLAGARAILSGRLAAGIPPHDLVPALLLAAMSEIGSRWEQDSLQIFEEHLATETTARLLAELPAMASPVQRIGRKALVSGVPDDHIQIVPLALAVYLELRGWTALSLGHGLPAGQIAAAMDRLDLRKLGHPALEGITEIGDRRVRVAAVTDGARGFQGTLVFASLDKVKEIARTPPGRYSAILVRFRDGADRKAALERLRAILPECSVLSSAELSRLTRGYYFANTGIGGSFGFSTVIAVLIGVVIISLTMYTSVLSRSRDFAVLRALGGRRWDVAVVVISEAMIITGTGLFLGFLMLAALLNATGGSEIPSYFPAAVPPILAGGTVAVSLLGSLIALRMALRAEPASVFH